MEDSKLENEIDKVWKELDNYNKGYLDLDEAKFFMDELVPIIGEPIAANYRPEHFEAIFNVYDEQR